MGERRGGDGSSVRQPYPRLQHIQHNKLKTVALSASLRIQPRLLQPRGLLQSDREQTARGVPHECALPERLHILREGTSAEAAVPPRLCDDLRQDRGVQGEGESMVALVEV